MAISWIVWHWCRKGSNWLIFLIERLLSCPRLTRSKSLHFETKKKHICARINLLMEDMICFGLLPINHDMVYDRTSGGGNKHYFQMCVRYFIFFWHVNLIGPTSHSFIFSFPVKLGFPIHNHINVSIFSDLMTTLFYIIKYLTYIGWFIFSEN